MSRVVFAEAATATAVGSDIADDTEVGSRERTRSVPRLIKRAAVTGSAGAADCSFIIKIGGTDVSGGAIWNSRTGPSPADLADWVGINAFVPPGEPIQIIVDDASGTNIAYVHLDIVDLV